MGYHLKDEMRIERGDWQPSEKGLEDSIEFYPKKKKKADAGGDS